MKVALIVLSVVIVFLGMHITDVMHIRRMKIAMRHLKDERDDNYKARHQADIEKEECINKMQEVSGENIRLKDDLAKANKSISDWKNSYKVADGRYADTWNNFAHFFRFVDSEMSQVKQNSIHIQNVKEKLNSYREDMGEKK